MVVKIGKLFDIGIHCEVLVVCCLWRNRISVRDAIERKLENRTIYYIYSWIYSTFTPCQITFLTTVNINKCYELVNYLFSVEIQIKMNLINFIVIEKGNWNIAGYDICHQKNTFKRMTNKKGKRTYT